MKIFKKHLLSLILTLAILFSGLVPVAAMGLPQSDWGLLINGQEVTIPSDHGGLRNYKGRLYAPLRFVSETLGAKVTWSASQPDQVIIEKGSLYLNYSTTRNTVKDKEGKVILTMTGEESVEVTPLLDPSISRMFLPIRFVVEPLGYQVITQHRKMLSIPQLTKERYAVITGGEVVGSVEGKEAYEKMLMERGFFEKRGKSIQIKNGLSKELAFKHKYTKDIIANDFGASGVMDIYSIDLSIEQFQNSIVPRLEYRIRGWSTPGIQGILHDLLRMSAKTEADGEFIWEQLNKALNKQVAVGNGKEGVAPHGTSFEMGKEDDYGFIRLYLK